MNCIDEDESVFFIFFCNETFLSCVETEIFFEIATSFCINVFLSKRTSSLIFVYKFMI
jgi:hypothetical protein